MAELEPLTLPPLSPCEFYKVRPPVVDRFFFSAPPLGPRRVWRSRHLRRPCRNYKSSHVSVPRDHLALPRRNAQAHLALDRAAWSNRGVHFVACSRILTDGSQSIVLDAFVICRSGYRIHPFTVHVHHTGSSRSIPVLDEYGGKHVIQRSTLIGDTGATFVLFHVVAPNQQIEAVVLFRSPASHRAIPQSHIWCLSSVDYSDEVDARKQYHLLFWGAPRRGVIDVNENESTTHMYL
ncbi:hypothetical protein HWV62_35933 [Athelia sp. TMB]|nr:hypothetical protein HWV62_35933 [Athelia sp. TMB]